ncbi:hypothetical protein IWX49DRAFT_513562 [Phyllosticta citricarpa]|uniref:SH3 domain-containing protein n=2 Tax=Phyllosticta TaxID=121621 RepID=A0ABR1L2D9_9PEZI
MAAVVVDHKSESQSPPAKDPSHSPPVSTSPSTLPPLVTSPESRPSNSARASSYAKNRLSTFSQASAAHRSRPTSTAYPVFHSSLSYTLVRDFAYPPYSPLFYGPLPEQHSEISTPVSESQSRRLSDPPLSWDGSRVYWGAGPWESAGEQLPSSSFGDGPPWSEDEDLHSPVVTSARHKKHKSSAGEYDTRGRSTERDAGPRRGSYTGTNGDGSQTYYVSDLDEANGPGGEFITYPASDDERNLARRASEGLPRRKYSDQDGLLYSEDDTSDASSQGGHNEESRFSRDYQFTIASPDEEMHGKAVALFDFERENDNELPLTEGQIILVSYRHGQGWLVAQDPRTGESGLVPEEYVRLLRDIEGGWNGLMNGNEIAQEASFDETNEPEVAPPSLASPGLGEALTPTQNNHRRATSGLSGTSGHSASNSEFYTPVVSTFSTSSKDLERFPQHLLGSQVTTPVGDGTFPRRGSKASTQTNSPRKEDTDQRMEENGHGKGSSS